MSVYMCLKCFEVYDKEKVIADQNFNICPKSNCVGQLIEVDELMLPTIKILNQKGYYTKYCCSGHYYHQIVDGYIMFSNGINIPFIPNGFHKEIYNDNVVIRNDIISKPGKRPGINDFKKICDNAKTLVDWAIKLPHNKNL